MFKSIGLFGVAALMTSVVSAGEPLTFTPVDSDDFVGEYYPGTQPGYGVMVVEGARGGMPDVLAQKIAATGYPVLSVAYFKESGLPDKLEELPLEYLQKPKQWLLVQSETRDDGLVMAGWSKGAELTLNTVARDGDYKGSSGVALEIGPEEPQPTRGTVEVVRTLEHDPALFTQGLQVVGDQIYESTGRYGDSQVQRRPLSGGPATASVPMADNEFGEGLAVTQDTLWTLTWREQVAHDRDPQTLEVRREVPYEGEGWGLCSDGARLIMSDGSDRLTFRDAATFEPTGTVSVTAGGVPVPKLNELECADGSVLANVWMTDEIVRIDPGTGAVTAVYDAAALEQPRPPSGDAVLNGIAALPDSSNVLITGKMWPTMYEVRLVD